MRDLHDGAGLFQQVHSEEGTALEVKAIVAHGDDMGVAQRGEDLKLLCQCQRRVLIALGGKLQLAGHQGDVFERDRLTRQAIKGAIHCAHAAFAESVEQMIAIAEGQWVSGQPCCFVCHVASHPRIKLHHCLTLGRTNSKTAIRHFPSRFDAGFQFYHKRQWLPCRLGSVQGRFILTDFQGSSNVFRTNMAVFSDVGVPLG